LKKYFTSDSAYAYYVTVDAEGGKKKKKKKT